MLPRSGKLVLRLLMVVLRVRLAQAVVVDLVRRL
jgi:hypothetical protein